METFNRRNHWENIYQNKQMNEVSWYQPTPQTSLGFFREYNVPATAKIIDVGGGDSLLVDYLLDAGYKDITVLDISPAAIERAKQRLAHRASKVKWIVADASNFQPEETYDFWHDRAAFHFLTTEEEIARYLQTARQYINSGGIMVIGTFSEQGPLKCSGLEIKQYSEESLSKLMDKWFTKLKCFTEDHRTPFDTIQNFIFCSFRKLPF